ncbi:MAG: 2OG-Fe(II) oxygenase [Acidimicrobiales bacterium]
MVLDDMFHYQVVSQAVRDFPRPDEMAPKAGKSGVLELGDPTRVPRGLRQMSDELLGLRFTAWLSAVTGIDGLKTDPDGSWGALRQSGDGVEGKIHVPPAQHPDKPWYRRLTLILHLTDGLTEANGGCFQLWDSPDGPPRTVIPPLFNSAVVFLSFPSAFHNASRTNLGPGQMRRVMQALYYTENPPG